MKKSVRITFRSEIYVDVDVAENISDNELAEIAFEEFSCIRLWDKDALEHDADYVETISIEDEETGKPLM